MLRISNAYLLKFHLFALFMGWTSLSHSQDVIRYTTKDGLPSNHVYDIKQDSDGYMWFATNRGVAKFDGVSFKTFTTKDGLPNNDIWLLETDNQGRLWYLSKSKYQGYIKDDRVHSFITEDSTAITPYVFKNNEDIQLMYHQIIYRLENSVWEKVFSIEQMHKKWSKLVDLYSLSKDKTILAVDINGRRNILLDGTQKVTLDQQLNLISHEKEKFNNPLTSEGWIRYGQLPNQTYYQTCDKGIVFLDLVSGQIKSAIFEEVIGQNNIEVAGCFGMEDEIQVSMPGHLLIFNYQFELVEKYAFPESVPNHRSLRDRSGNIWLIDFVHGVTMIRNTNIQSVYYLEDKGVQKIGTIHGTLYAGVKSEGFYTFDGLKKNWSIEFDKLSINTHTNVYGIKSEGESETGYLITSLKIFRSNDHEFTRIPDISDHISLGGKDIIRHDNKEYILHPQAMIIIDLTTGKSILDESIVQHHIVKHNDLLYTGASDGLFRLVDDKLANIPVQHEILHAPVNHMVDQGQFLVVGTDGRGIYLYSEMKVIHIVSTDGLIVQKSIVEDKNTLWLATQDGVKKVSLDSANMGQSKITDAFYEADGLLQNNTNDIYFEDTIMYVACDRGLAKLNISNPIYKTKPKISFTTTHDTLIFKYDENEQISASFSVLNYVNQDNYTYSYKLLPIHKEWISTNTKTLNFTNLSPRKYTLEVKALDQHENQNIAKLYIHVLPAWWQTRVAKIGFGVFGLAALAWIYGIVTRRVRRKEAEKAQHETRIAGLELQALRSQMNPHFIHNSLNAIQYFIQRNEVDLSEEYLANFSKLIRLFFEHSRRQAISVQEEIELLESYLQIEKLRFEDKLSYHIEVVGEFDTEDRTIPSMILQPIVENAVNHGLFHKASPGLVTITFTALDEDSFSVKVKDDGIGIIKAKEIFNQSTKNYQSRSSMVLEERLELLSMSEDWTITYKITDLSTISTISGTLVELTFQQPNLL